MSENTETVKRDPKPVVKTKVVDFKCPQCETDIKGDAVEAFSKKGKVERRAIKARFECKECGYSERAARSVTITHGDKSNA